MNAKPSSSPSLPNECLLPHSVDPNQSWGSSHKSQWNRCHLPQWKLKSLSDEHVLLFQFGQHGAWRNKCSKSVLNRDIDCNSSKSTAELFPSAPSAGRYPTSATLVWHPPLPPTSATHLSHCPPLTQRQQSWLCCQKAPQEVLSPEWQQLGCCSPLYYIK